MPTHRQWLWVMKLSCRMINMDESLLTKQIYIGCLKQMNSKCRSWFYGVNTFLACHDMVWYGNILFDIVHNIIENILPKHKNM